MKLRMACAIAGTALVACVLAAPMAWERLIGRRLPLGSAATAVAPASTSELPPSPGSRPPHALVALTLDGLVTGLASPDAPLEVDVLVGDSPVRAHVSGRRYRASILASGDALIRVRARSTRVDYRAIAGTAARLKRASGGDGVVDERELGDLVVSPFSSAVDWLVGKVRQRFPALDHEEALKRIDSGAVVELAYVLTAVTQGGIALPDGYTTGQALVENPQAYASVLSANPPDPGSIDAVLDAAPLVTLTSLAQIPEPLVLVGDVRGADRDLEAGRTLALTQRTAGQFILYANDPMKDARVSAQVADGQLTLAPAATVYRYREHNGQGLLDELLGMSVRRLTAGERFSLWLTNADWRTLNVATGAQTHHRERRLWTGVDTAREAQRLRPLGTRALPWICPGTRGPWQVPTVCQYAPHTLQGNGTGTTQYHGWKIDSAMQPVDTAAAGRSFTHVWDGGAYTITHAEASVRFIGLGASTAFTPTLFMAEGTGAQAGMTLSGYLLSLRSATSSDPSPLGVWSLAATRAQPQRWPMPEETFRVERLADGTVDDRYLLDGQSQEQTPGKWTSAAGGQVYDLRSVAVFDSQSRYVVDCARAFSEGATRCAPVRYRYFKPLVRFGAQVWGVEEYYYQSAAPLAPGQTPNYRITLAVSRPGMYECQAGACATEAVTLVSARVPTPAVPGRWRPAYAIRRAALMRR